MRGRRLAIALGAVMVLGLLAWRLLAAPAPEAEAPQPSLAVQWSPGTRYVYQLELDGETRVAGAQGLKAMGGRARLSGELLVRGLAGQQAALSLGVLTQSSIEVNGQAVEGLQLSGAEALLTLDNGRVTRVGFHEGDPASFKNLAQLIVGELSLSLDRAQQWSANEQTARGLAESRYTRVTGSGGTFMLSRVRPHYASALLPGVDGQTPVDGQAEVTVRSGVLDALTGRERLGPPEQPVSTLTLSLKLLREEPDPATAMEPFTQVVAPAAPVPAMNAREQMLAQQIDGLTADVLFDTLAKFASGGIIRNQNHFLLQAAGLLAKDPALCERMVDVFTAQGFSYRGKGMVLDLLVGAGTPAAQLALTKSLGSPQAKAETSYNILLARLSFLTSPEPATVVFARETYEATKDQYRSAAALALGGVAGTLHKRGHGVESSTALAKLITDLQQEPPGKMRDDLVLALGNAGVPEHADLLIRFSGDADPHTRWAAVNALRKLEGPHVRAAMLGAANDKDVKVQQVALQTMLRQNLEPLDLVTLKNQVLAGGLAKWSQADLVSLLSHYRSDPSSTQMLRFLLTQESVDPQIRVRIRSLLGES